MKDEKIIKQYEKMNLKSFNLELHGVGDAAGKRHCLREVDVVLVFIFRRWPVTAVVTAIERIRGARQKKKMLITTE